MANEFLKPKKLIREQYQAIKIPINQYTGVKATYQTVPFLCVKRTINKTEPEESKTEFNKQKSFHKPEVAS